MLIVAFEIEHGVDKMFERLRSCDHALLGDMADKNGGDVVILGYFEELDRGGAYLCDTARFGGDVTRVDGLDRVDEREARFFLCDGRADGLGIRFS